MKTVLIATAKRPRDFAVFAAALRGAVAEEGLRIPAMLLTDGPGCVNWAFRVDADEAEATRFANELTLVLMPAKWSFTNEAIPDGDTDARQ